MRDAETGSWWQQVSGEAIQGASKGQKLEEVFHDELTFAVWKSENPNGRVLRPDEKILAAQKYESANWEDEIGKLPVKIAATQDTTFAPRTLVIGVVIGDKAKAYPISALEMQSPILDMIGGKDVVVILGADKKSVRAFERNVDGKTLEFFVKPETKEIIDAETGSVWNFSGEAVSGELSGKQLNKISVLKDFWFDWKIYHPNTQIYALGAR